LLWCGPCTTVPEILLALAGAAGAILAAVGQPDALADARGQHGLARVDGETAAAGLDGNLETSSFRYPRGVRLCAALDFALKPDPSRRAAGALPPRTVLLVGCGDVGLRVAAQLPARIGLTAVTSSPAAARRAACPGIRPLLANLDEPASLRRLAGLATRVLHLAPPPGEGWTDPRTRALMALLRTPPCPAPAALVYGSTSGVYGDCAATGSRRPDALRADTPARAPACGRRAVVRFFGRRQRAFGCCAAHPGHLRPDREGGTPRARLLKGTPVLRAGRCLHQPYPCGRPGARLHRRAVARPRATRLQRQCDDAQLKMGDYFDLAADLYGLPRPPRVARNGADRTAADAAEFHVGIAPAGQHPDPKRELRLALRYPDASDGIAIKNVAIQ
jgi:hypothetical protein